LSTKFNFASLSDIYHTLHKAQVTVYRVLPKFLIQEGLIKIYSFLFETFFYMNI